MNTLAALSADARQWAQRWPEFVRLDVDGYPASTPGNGSAGVGGGGGVSRPTEAAVLRREPQSDRVRDARREIQTTWAIVHACLIARGRMVDIGAAVAPIPLTLQRLHLGADLLARLEREPGPRPVVGLSDAEGIVWETWGSVVEALESHRQAIGRAMGTWRADVRTEAAAARCAVPECDRLGVRTGLCWAHYREQLEVG